MLLMNLCRQGRCASAFGLFGAGLLAAGFVSGSYAQSLPDARQAAAYVEQLLDEQKLARNDPSSPGLALLVARGDQLLYKGARGMASIELGVPLSTDHVFRIGSVTKQIAAAALLKLIDEGRAGLDDPLSKFLPDYPKGETISLLQLLNHSSGIKSYTGIPGYMDNPVRRQLSTKELLAEFQHLPPDFAPGAGWLYNNSGYVLVGAVIEAITGKPWHDYIDAALLAPTRLSRTAYPGETRLIKGMVNGYDFDPKLGVVGDGLLSMTQPHAAGALVSTVEDLWRWNLALHGGKLLAPASYARMITPEGPAAASNYGFGIASVKLRGQTALQHTGGINGFQSLLAYLPQSGVSIALLRNTTAPGFNASLFTQKLGAFLIGKPYPQNHPVALAPEQLSALEGVYTLAQAKGEAQSRTLRVEEGRLMSIRSGGRPTALIPLGQDLFAFSDSVARLRAQRGSDGKVAGLTVYQDGDGAAEAWTRSGELPAQMSMVLPPSSRP